MKLKKIISILLVVLWMITIFLFSNQQGTSSGNTSKTIAIKIVEIMDFKDNLTLEQTQEISDKIEPYLRKVAHFSIYLIGGILLMNVAQQLVEKENRQMALAGILGMLYAISDEIHQVFIPARSGRMIDVFIDTLGVFTGVCIFVFAFKLVVSFKEKKKEIKRGN